MMLSTTGTRRFGADRRMKKNNRKASWKGIEPSLGLRTASKKAVSWGVFRRLSTLVEGIWSNRGCCYLEAFKSLRASKKHSFVSAEIS